MTAVRRSSTQHCGSVVEDRVQTELLWAACTGASSSIAVHGNAECCQTHGQDKEKLKCGKACRQCCSHKQSQCFPDDSTSEQASETKTRRVPTCWLDTVGQS